MRADQIIRGYIDPTKISKAMYDEMVDALERIGATPPTDDFIQLMYCDRRDELELEQLQIDLVRTRTEVESLKADTRDRGAARREFAASKTGKA